MAIKGQIPVEFGMVFPGSAYAAGPVEKVRDFERSRKDEVIQQLDKDSGLPLWVVEVIDAQEDARQRTVKVKIAAQVQPVLPSPVPGSPFTPVEFDGMTVFPYVDASRCPGQGQGKCAARIAYSLKAAGIRAPLRGLGRPAPEPHKDAA
jgi:hypothetical protein